MVEDDRLAGACLELLVGVDIRGREGVLQTAHDVVIRQLVAQRRVRLRPNTHTSPWPRPEDRPQQRWADLEGLHGEVEVDFEAGLRDGGVGIDLIKDVLDWREVVLEPGL